MAKWCGKIGFADPMVEIKPGIWMPEIVERSYYGEMVINRWKRQNSGNVNDDINVTNDISIIADPYAMNHCSTMVYAEIMGAKWKITNVEIQRPRLILSIGGIYNGQTPGTTDQTGGIIGS